MGFWAAFPFLRYVFWLMAGIVVGNQAYTSNSGTGWIITFLLALSYAFMYFFRNRNPEVGLGQEMMAGALFFTFGFSRMAEHKENLYPTTLPEDVSYYLLEAETDPVQTPKTMKIQARIRAYQVGESWKEARGKIILYIKNLRTGLLPEQGDSFLVKAKLNTLPPPLNPAVFNYKKHLERQGICCQAFITPDQLQLVGRDPEFGFSLRRVAHKLRSQALVVIEKYVNGKQEAAIVSSLVLGYRETLDQELVQAYSTAGTMHVLAVSGLHVGILYLILKFFFRGWKHNWRGKWGSYLLILLVLWGYAFLTGLSPSVLRAVLMFSVIEAAQIKKRKTSIYNSLAIAAFVLLVADPSMLWAVGFQLSFLAVLGIVYLQPKIAEWYTGERKALRWSWDYIAASLAAQFATFPLALYYFGQFPTYFFIANLLVVPFVPLIFGLSLGMLVFSLFSSTLAAVFAWALFWGVKLINGIAFTVEAFPYSRLTAHLTDVQLGLLVAGLLLLLLFFRFRKIYHAILLFLVFSVFFGSLCYKVYSRKNQKKLIVYHIPGYSLLQLVEGREEFFLADEDLPSSRVQYQVQPYRKVLEVIRMGSENSMESAFHPPVLSKDGYSLVAWRGLKIVRVDKELPEPCLEKNPVAVDYILLSHNAVKELEQLSCYFSGGTLIIDGSNQAFLQRKLVDQAESLNLPFHLTAEAGAFELNL